MKLIIEIIEKITVFAGYLSALLIVPLIGSMIWEVTSRYVFSAPTDWAFEVGYMLMGSAFVWGMAYALKMHNNVRVDFFYFALSNKLRATIDLICYVALIILVMWLVYGLWDYFSYAYDHNEKSGVSAWNPAVWPFRLSLLFGFVIFGLQIFAEILKNIYVVLGATPPGSAPEALINNEELS